MSSSWIILLEFTGVIGVVLGLGGWELWRLRREQARDVERRRAAGALESGESGESSAG